MVDWGVNMLRLTDGAARGRNTCASMRRGRRLGASVLHSTRTCFTSAVEGYYRHAPLGARIDLPKIAWPPPSLQFGFVVRTLH